MSDSQVFASITMVANAVMFVGAGVGSLSARRHRDRTAPLYALFTLLGLTGACVGAATVVRPASSLLAWFLTAVAAASLITGAVLLRQQRRRVARNSHQTTLARDNE